MRRKDREVSDIKAITDILDLCRTASIAMADEQTPYVVPLSYGYELKDILRRNNRVCFTVFCEGEPVQTEIPCNCGYYFSSIIGNGTAQFIEDPDEKRYALGKMFEHQTGKKAEFTRAQADSVCVFQIVSRDFTGKRKSRQ